MILSLLFALSVAMVVWDRLPLGPFSVYRVLQWPLVALALLGLLQQRSITIPLQSRTLWWMLALVGALMLSSLAAWDLGEGTVQLLRYLGYVLTALIWMLVLKNCWEGRLWVLFSWLMIGVASAMALTVLTDFLGFTEFYRWYGQERPYVRQAGLLGEANYAALKLGVLLPVGLFLAGWYFRQRRLGLGGVAIGAALLVSGAILLTGSRMGGLFLALIWGAFAVRERDWLWRPRAVVTVGALGGILAFVLMALTPPQELEKGINYLVSRYGVLLEFVQTGEERFGAVRETSLRERFDVWAAGVQIFADHPWLGVGLGNFPLIVGQYNPSYAGIYSHNTYLAVLAELGLVGMVLFLGLCVQIWRALGQISERPGLVFYLRLSLGVLLVGFLFLYDFEGKLLWGLFVPFALARDTPSP
ncbi:MAG: O-antigen ligase family protein [candidate division WOR-3 bacterium]